MGFFQDLKDTVSAWIGLPWFQKKDTGPSIVELKKEIANLATQLQNYATENTALKRNLAEIKAAEIKAAENCKYGVDWDRMRVVSIERLVDTDGIEKTMFGFIDETGKLSSNWHFFCSRERHDELVAEFNEYKNNRGQVL